MFVLLLVLGIVLVLVAAAAAVVVVVVAVVLATQLIFAFLWTPKNPQIGSQCFRVFLKPSEEKTL